MEHFPIYPAILLQIVGFFVLFGLLKTFFFGPIGHVINDRERIVRERLDDAEASRVKMNAAREDYEKRIAEIEAEARNRIQEAMKQANATKDEMLAGAHTQADSIVAKGKADLEREREKVEATLRDRIADLAVTAAGRIISKNLDAKTQRSLVDEVLNQVK
jgi:F-type H+-transporting ATPase subunit b